MLEADGMLRHQESKRQNRDRLHTTNTLQTIERGCSNNLWIAILFFKFNTDIAKNDTLIDNNQMNIKFFQTGTVFLLNYS